MKNQTVILIVIMCTLACESPMSGLGPDSGTDPNVIVVGDFPNGIAVDENHIYVAIGQRHGGPNSLPVAAGQRSVVQVFSTVDHRLEKEIDVAAGGHAMRMTPDGAELYLAHFGLDRVVTVISTATLDVAAVVGGSLQVDIAVPDAVAVSSDGRYAYVGSNTQNSAWVSRIDTTTHQIDTGWRVNVLGGYVCWVAVAPGDDVLYVNSWIGGSVQRKLVATQQDDIEAAVGDFPHAVAIDPTGAYVYAMVSGGNRVVKLDGVTLQEVTEIVGPWAGVWGGPVSGELSASGKTLFVANHALGAVAVVDIDPGSATLDSVIATVDVGNDPIFMALSADGQELYVANNESSTIEIVDVGGYP